MTGPESSGFALEGVGGAVESMRMTTTRRAGSPERYVALFDGQCEICRAAIGWIHVLDRGDAVECVALETIDVAALHPDLRLEECLRELHVVTPDGEIWRGWDAIVGLLGIFSATRVVAGANRWAAVHAIGARTYAFVAARRAGTSPAVSSFAASPAIRATTCHPSTSCARCTDARPCGIPPSGMLRIPSLAGSNEWG